MDHNDRQAIEGVFNRLAEVSRQGAPRDPEAETFIRQTMARQEGSAYLLAQTVVVQDNALQNAQSRIEQLEYELQSRAAAPAQSGGFMSRLFGGAAPAAPRPAMAPQGQRPMGYGGQQQGFGQQQQPAQGGGFLAGAAQTAVGVAGGVILGNMIGGMFAGSAEAAPAPVEEMPEDDMGGDQFDDGGYVEDDSE